MCLDLFNFGGFDGGVVPGWRVLGCCFFRWWFGDLRCGVGGLDLRFWVCFLSGVFVCRPLGCELLCVGSLGFRLWGLFCIFAVGVWFVWVPDCLGIVCWYNITF